MHLIRIGVEDGDEIVIIFDEDVDHFWIELGCSLRLDVFLHILAAPGGFVDPLMG
jgi:hypothetical protein